MERIDLFYRGWVVHRGMYITSENFMSLFMRRIPKTCICPLLNKTISFSIYLSQVFFCKRRINNKELLIYVLLFHLFHFFLKLKEWFGIVFSSVTYVLNFINFAAKIPMQIINENLTGSSKYNPPPSVCGLFLCFFPSPLTSRDGVTSLRFPFGVNVSCF